MTTHRLGREARSGLRGASDNPWLERVARLGFAASGLLHLLIAYIALRVAWGQGGGQPDQSGALSLLAQSTWGRVVLWVACAGLAALGVEQLLEAVTNGGGDAKEQLARRGKPAGKAVVYLVLASTFFSFAHGSGSSSSRKDTELTARLMQHTGGRVLVVLIGVVVLVVGGYHVLKGVRRSYRDDLRSDPPAAVDALAVAGYVAKGVALAVVGVLFCIAGIHRQPGRASGLDGALKTLRDQPAGPVLLTVVAIGLAAYGLYSFCRARLAKL
jgi:hypothetical protein